MIASSLLLFAVSSFLTMTFASAAFHHTPRPAIVRIVALPMSEEQQQQLQQQQYVSSSVAKTFDYYYEKSQPDHDDDDRKSISAAPSFDEYMKQRAGDY